MKTIPGPLQAHLNGDTTTLALCWAILKRNGDYIRGTTHDRDVPVASGIYAGIYEASSNITPSNVKSNSDLAVDNLDIAGAWADNTIRVDITRADIEARNLDFASVRTFFVNWAAPDDGQVPMRSGFLGPITYDSNGGYSTQVRGLAQLLQQNIVQTYSDRCIVKRLGDARCGVDVASLSIAATVMTVVSRREFIVSGIGAQPAGYFSLGNLTGLTGDNIGFLRQIRLDDVSSETGHLSLFEPFPEDILVGDTFTMSPGCDRLLQTCITKFDNLRNNRAYGVLIPGIDLLLAGPAGQMSTPS
jgi:uncharacterized phage protein (TIGR02218 family)